MKLLGTSHGMIPPIRLRTRFHNLNPGPEDPDRASAINVILPTLKVGGSPARCLKSGRRMILSQFSKPPASTSTSTASLRFLKLQRRAVVARL